MTCDRSSWDEEDWEDHFQHNTEEEAFWEDEFLAWCQERSLGLLRGGLGETSDEVLTGVRYLYSVQPVNSPVADPPLRVKGAEEERETQTMGRHKNKKGKEKELKKEEKKLVKRDVRAAEKHGGVIGDVVSSGAGALANMVLPGSGGAVHGLSKAILNGLGFAEQSGDGPEVKHSQIPADFGGGSQIVAAADAPVQFGRTGGPAMFSRVTHRAENGDVIVHLKEPLADVATAATLNTRGSNQVMFTPAVSTLVASRQFALDFEQWRPIAAKIHYTHWAATTTVARTQIAHSADPLFSVGANPTFIQLVELADSAVGGAYEDFYLDIDCSELPYDWFWVAASDPSDALGSRVDRRLNIFGALWWATDLNNVQSTTIGSLFIEWVLAFRGAKPPDILIGVSQTLNDPECKLTREEKLRVYDAVLRWKELPTAQRPALFPGVGIPTVAAVAALARAQAPTPGAITAPPGGAVMYVPAGSVLSPQ